MLDVRKLRLLRELARRGTIAAVAGALRYTPSAVSQQLAALEKEAGVALLERSGRGVVLTPAGVLLVEHTEAVLATLERADAAMAGARSGVTGRVRLGAFPSAVRTLLTPALVALGRDHPSLELLVNEVDPAAAGDALRAGDLDVALVQEYDFVPAEPDLAVDTEPLLDETIHLAVRRRLRLPPGTAGPISPISPAGATLSVASDRIASHRRDFWILGSPGTLCHAMGVRACQAAGFTPRVRHHVDDFATALALVAAGQGVALIPDLAVAGAPTIVALTPLEIRRRTRIAYRRGAGGHPAIAACVAAIRTAAINFHPRR